MKNLDKHDWDFTIHEQAVIDWLEANGFEVTINKRSVAKDIISIEKDSHSETFELPLTRKNFDPNGYMRLVSKNFELGKELAQLRKMANV